MVLFSIFCIRHIVCQLKFRLVSSHLVIVLSILPNSFEVPVTKNIFMHIYGVVDITFAFTVKTLWLNTFRKISDDVSRERWGGRT